MIPELTRPPYRLLADRLKGGDLVPFLGAGASLEASSTATTSDGLPTGRELAYRLAEHIGLRPDEIDIYDLIEVASCFALYTHRLDLEETLQEIFLRQRPPGSLHNLLARVQAPLLIITTNYDSLIESSFRELGRPFHLIMTPVDTSEKRYVLWWPPDATEPRSEREDRLLLSPDLPVIYKMHGGFDPVGKWHTSVVTEEDYFEIGGRLYETSLLPIQLRAKLSKSSLLFLGYSLRDMHVRHLVAKSCRWGPGRTSHLISRDVSKLDHLRFSRLGVHIYKIDIESFVEELEAAFLERGSS
jgi:hypothetical protein